MAYLERNGNKSQNVSAVNNYAAGEVALG